jgi:hypothetical protein
MNTNRSPLVYLAKRRNCIATMTNGGNKRPLQELF